MTDALGDCRLRLEGAHDHLDSIETQISEFLQQNPYHAIGEFDRHGMEYVVKVHIAQQRPRRLSNTIGDFFHNLRSALDQLMNSLATAPGTSGAPPDTEFPIFKDLSHFYRTETDGSPARRSGLYKMRGLTDRRQRAIVESVQPFHAVNDPEGHPLWVIHDFAVIDKHRKPHLTGALLEGSYAGIRAMSGVDLDIEHWGLAGSAGPFKNGTVVGKMRLTITKPNPVLEMDYNFSFGVAFDPKGPARGASVIDTLSGLLTFVETEVIAKLEPFV